MARNKAVAILTKKYTRGTVFEGEERIEALIKVLKIKSTIIYLLEDQEMSDGSLTVTLKLHYK